MVKKFKVSGSAASAKAASQESTPMYDSAQGLPDNGPYRMRMIGLRVGEVKNGDNAGEPKIVLAARVNEPEGTKKAKYNGYPTYLHVTALDKYAGRINKLIDVVFGGKTASQRQKAKDAFWNDNVAYDEATDDITKFGTLAVPADVEFGANLSRRPATEQYEASVNVGSIFPASDLPAPIPADDEDLDDDEAEEMEEEVEDSEEETEDAAREAELEAMKLVELRAVAKKLGISTRGVSQDDLIEEILAAEFPEDDEDEEEPEEPEEDEDDEEDDEEEPEDEEDDNEELREELGGLSLPKLKARAKANGAKLAEYKGLDAEGLIEFIIGQEAEEEEEPEDEEDEEEPEEEPEPAKPARRSSRASAKTPAAKTRRGSARRRKGDDEDPPF